MKKIFGSLLSIIGTLVIFASVFLAYDGKYGFDAFMNSFPNDAGSPQALSMCVPGILVLMIGINLLFNLQLFSRKKP